MISEEFEMIKGFIDPEGRVTAFPSKRKKKLRVLLYLSRKFQPGRVYTEKEVNELLGQWHTFGDPATLRRELYDHWLIDRDQKGAEYRLSEKQPTIEELEEKYG